MQVKIFDIGDTLDDDFEKDLEKLNKFLKEHKGKIQEIIGNIGTDSSDNLLNVFHVFYEEEDSKKNTLSS